MRESKWTTLVGRVVLLLIPALALCDGVTAAPAGKIKLPSGFRAELVYNVPLQRQGSWVSLTHDDKGRLIAGDQEGGIYRITPSPIGGDLSKTKIEKLDVNVGMAQGLLFHDGALYVMQNGDMGSFSSGLYRLKDTNGDDKFDHVEQLRVFEAAGEHGPHAVILAPDGKHLYLCAGNFTPLPRYSKTFVPPCWGEDQLLPRIDDPRGHGVQVKAPAGWIARTDLDGNNLEVISIGYRNIFDIAFNEDGELFTFDSDMEWDIGAPWYRPTRVCHVIPGADFGFRAGNGPWPAYFIDTLPTVVDAGPSSPTGLTFGAGTKFPPKYQQALFAGDWSYGNIFVFHIHPEGSTYRGELERFASAMPLGVTDMTVGKDGALYFCVGGRQSESAMYRIVYTGEGTEAVGASAAANLETAPPTAGTSKPLATAEVATAPALSPSEARQLLHSLEHLEQPAGPRAVNEIWPHLGDADRFLSTAARVALEHQPLEQWRDRALSEPNFDVRINALVAYARHADRAQQADWAKATTVTKFAELDAERRLNMIRAAALGVIRFDPLEPAVRQQLIDAFSPQLPTNQPEVDRELGHLLVRLQAPHIVDRMLTLLDNAATQEEAIDLAMTLSVLPNGWNIDERRHLLGWFDKSSHMAGGMSFFGYLSVAREKILASLTADERGALADLVNKPYVEATVQIQAESRPFVREWKFEELCDLVEQDKRARNYQNGRKMFSAAGCYNCHRVAGSGSSVGPDLTGVGGRFGVRDLLRAIVDPNQTISDQYQQTVFEANGKVVVGRVTNLFEDKIQINTNMLDPKAVVSIPRNEVENQSPSKVSMMPMGLLNTLSSDEILDLIAFLRAGGRADSDLFAAGSR
jgi:putative heme-binding domain-containing protein